MIQRRNAREREEVDESHTVTFFHFTFSSVGRRFSLLSVVVVVIVVVIVVDLILEMNHADQDLRRRRELINQLNQSISVMLDNENQAEARPGQGE